MVGSRTATAIVGLLFSLVVSVAAWMLFDTLLLFLLVPFVPFLFRRRTAENEVAIRECPVCGFKTRTQSYEYCPHDGAELESSSVRQ